MERLKTKDGAVIEKIVDRDETANIPGSVLTAKWITDVQSDLRAIQEAAGLPDAPGSEKQVLRAIESLARDEATKAARRETKAAHWAARTGAGSRDLYGVASRNSEILAVGQAGTVARSTDDGISWTVSTAGTSRRLNGVAFNSGGVRFAVGASGEIVSSIDGRTWAKKTSGTNNDLYAIVFNGSVGLAVGSSGVAVRSTDSGATWTLITPSTFTLQDVVFAGGQFVAVGSSGTVITSADGQTWTPRTSGVTAPIESVHYADGRFVAVGGSGTIISSSDGITWKALTSGTPAYLYGVSYGAGHWSVFGAQGRALESDDAETWKFISIPTSDNMYAVAYAEGVEVAVGHAGRVLTRGQAPAVPVSGAIGRDEVLNLVPGFVWEIKRKTVGANDWAAAAHADGQFVVVGKSGAIGTSTDSVDWHIRITGFARNFTAVGRLGNLWAAVGQRGAIYTSPDGVLWTQRNSITNTQTLQDVTSTGSVHIVVGSTGTIGTSTDGVNWVARSLPADVSSTDLNAVYAAGGVILAAGSNGVILRSSDAATWIREQTYTSHRLNSIAYGAGLYIVVGSGGTILTSPDGATWTARESGTTRFLYKVKRNGGNFIAVGTNGAAVTSPDGITWTVCGGVTNATLLDISRYRGTWYAVGYNGTMVRSSDCRHWSVVPTGISTILRTVITTDREVVAAGDSGEVMYGSGNIPASSFLAQHLVTPETQEEFKIAAGLDGVDVKAGEWAFKVRAVQQASEQTLQLSLSRGTSPVLQTSYRRDGRHELEFAGDIRVDGGIVSAKPFSHIIGPGKWSDLSNTGEQHLQHGMWVSGSTVITVGNLGTLYRSADGGKTYAIPAYFSSISEPIFAICDQAPVNGRNLFAVGNNSLLAFSSDQGATWSSFYDTSGVTWTGTRIPLHAIAYARPSNNLQVFCAAGYKGKIFQFFHDSGGWTSAIRTASGADETLFGVASSGSTWVAVGGNGMILRSVNDGTSWSVVSAAASSSATLFAVTHVTGTQWVAVGGSGLIRRSVDNGATWETVASVGVTCRAVVYAESQFILAADDGNVLVGTSIEHLTKVNIGADDDLRGAAIDNGTAYVCGARAVIKKNTKITF